MKSRDRLILSVLGVAGLMAAIWFLAIAPKREQATKLNTDIAAAETRRDAAVANATQAEQAKASYRRDYATIARLGKAVPARADVPSLVYQLESSAKRAKVDFRSVTLSDVAPAAPGSASAAGPAGILPTPFSFTFQGEFFSLRKLLANVDRFAQIKGDKVNVSGRLLTIDGVTLTAGADGLPQVKAEVTAKAYVAERPSELPGAKPGAAAAPAPATTTTPTSAPAAEVAP